MVFLDINKGNFKNHNGTNQNLITQLDYYIHHKIVFVLVYMEYCEPCNKVKPEWNKLKNVLNKYENSKDVAIVSIDKDLIHKVKYIKQHPTSFPAIRFIFNRGNSIEEYEDSNVKNKDRSIDSFVEWINLKLEEKKPYLKKIKTIGNTKKKRGGKWSAKYKHRINCRKPKGFSQRQYCKYSRKKK